jgi:NAD(P)-dependent dehydrogenase (short-subunit alcohol dehydrogenase family)
MLKDKTIVVTGATGGLGRAVVIGLAKEGAKVVALGRNAARLEETKREAPSIQTEIVDLGDRRSVQKAVDRLAHGLDQIDALLETAAVYKHARSTRDGLEEMFATNHLGPFQLTTRLEPLLRKGKARVVLVSAPSTTKLNFDDLQGEKKYSAFTAFGASKAANLLFAAELARRWKGTGITVDVFHPGLVKSSLMNESPWLMRTMLALVSSDPSKPAAALIMVADQPGVDGESRFFVLDKVSKHPKSSDDRDAQKRLWETSERLLAT